MTRSNNRRDHHAPLQPPPKHWAPLIGRAFGRLTVLGYTGVMTKFRQKKITCRCSCGSIVDVMVNYLKSGNTTSCGCAHSDMVGSRNASMATHGASTNGKITDLYRAWLAIKTRCLNPKSPPYKDYGGRGITMHAAWINSFEAFRDYIEGAIGPKPSRRYSLDRINNNKGYKPGNLRWATPYEQNRNTRAVLWFELNGEKHTLSDWAEIAGIPRDTVRGRVLRYDWPLDEALGTPPGFGRCPLEDRRKWTESVAYKERQERLKNEQPR